MAGRAAVRAVDGVDLTIRQGEFVGRRGPSGRASPPCSSCSARSIARPRRDRSSRAATLGRLGDRQPRRAAAARARLRLPAVQPDPDADRPRERRGRLAPRPSLDPLRALVAPRELLDAVGLAARRRPPALPAFRRGAAAGRDRPRARQRARVLLADEPTGNLDSKTGDAILALLYSLWKETGLTVVLITHDPAIAGTAPRVLRLADGRVLTEELPPADTAPDLASAGER